MLIVVRGYDYRGDLDALRPYISEYKPLLIGVDGGADALLEAGYKPDMIIGDMDSVLGRRLQSGAELIVHAYKDGRAPGIERVECLGLRGVVFPSFGTSEDAAMLLVDSNGAPLLVAVGTHYVAGGVPGQGSRRHGVDVPDPAAGRVQAGRRQGCVPDLPSQVTGWHLAAARPVRPGRAGPALTLTDVGGAVGNLLAARLRDLAYWIKELFS